MFQWVLTMGFCNSLAEHSDSVAVTADDVHVEFLDSFQQLLRRDFVYESV